MKYIICNTYRQVLLRRMLHSYDVNEIIKIKKELLQFDIDEIEAKLEYHGNMVEQAKRNMEKALDKLEELNK